MVASKPRVSFLKNVRSNSQDRIYSTRGAHMAAMCMLYGNHTVFYASGMNPKIKIDMKYIGGIIRRKY